MKTKNNDLTLINEVYRNAKTAILSIDAILSDVHEMYFFTELKAQKDGYSAILEEITTYMNDNGYTQNDVPPLKKTGMNFGIKMNTMFDSSTTHLAELMINGTLMGIFELTRLINGGKTNNEDIINFARKLVDLEDNYESRLKKFL